MFIISKSRVFDKLCFSIEKHSFQKNMFFVDKLCLSTWQTMFFRNSAFHSINLVFGDKLCFSSKKQCFSIEKHCLSAINSVFRFITHLACHKCLKLQLSKSDRFCLKGWCAGNIDCNKASWVSKFRKINQLSYCVTFLYTRFTILSLVRYLTMSCNFLVVQKSCNE